MKILCVEDDARDADITVRMLRKTAPHLQLETASTIHEARSRLGLLALEPLDLVLTDVHLPDGDGLSLLRHVRESSLPLVVVVVTGMGDEETYNVAQTADLSVTKRLVQFTHEDSHAPLNLILNMPQLLAHNKNLAQVNGKTLHFADFWE